MLSSLYAGSRGPLHAPPASPPAKGGGVAFKRKHSTENIASTPASEKRVKLCTPVKTNRGEPVISPAKTWPGAQGSVDSSSQHKRAVEATAPAGLKGTTPNDRQNPWTEHYNQHRANNAQDSRACSKCTYAKHRSQWSRKLQIRTLRSTWLHALPTSTADKDWGVGCFLCSWALNKRLSCTAVGDLSDDDRLAYAGHRITGQALRLSNLKRHARTEGPHKAAD